MGDQGEGKEYNANQTKDIPDLEEQDEIDKSQVLGVAGGDASVESISPHAYDGTLHDMPEKTGTRNLALPGLQSVQHLEKPPLTDSKNLPPKHSLSVKSLLPKPDSKTVDLILLPEGRSTYIVNTATYHINPDSKAGDLNLPLEGKHPYQINTAMSSLLPKPPPVPLQAASSKQANDSRHTTSSETHNLGHVMDIQDGQDNQTLQGFHHTPDTVFSNEAMGFDDLPSSETDKNLKMKDEDLSTHFALMQSFVNHPEHLRQDSALEQAFLGCRGPDTENWTPPVPNSDWLYSPDEAETSTEDTHPCSSDCGATVSMESGSDMCPECYEDFLRKTTIIGCEANKPPVTAPPTLIHQELFDITDEPMTQPNAMETKSHQLASFYIDSLCSIAGSLQTPVTQQPSPSTPISVRDKEKKKKNRCAVCHKKVKFTVYDA